MPSTYRNRFLYFLCSLLLLTIYSCKFRQKADTIIHHAVIYTANSKNDTAEAIVITDGKIVLTGSNDDVLKNYEADNVIDAGGKTILPGFIDAHCHFTGFATDMWKCDLTGTSSFNDIIDRIAAYSDTSEVQWIYGRGWDQNDWDVKEFPDKQILDSLFADRPVFLKRIDGHAALVNQKALDIAGITIDTKISGGSIEIRNGRLTGILIDNAMDLVDTKIPQIPDSLAQQFFLQAQQLCFAQGLTGVHDCGVGEHTIGLLDAAQKDGSLKMKVYALLSDSAQYYDRWIKKGPYITNRLHVGGFKLYADGALGSRGACLLHDYSDQAGWKGFLLSDTSHFADVAHKLINSGLQLCTHAIGDSGNRTILKLYSGILPAENDRRWRIEHAQVVDVADLHYFKDHHIIPSVQPTHATSDMYWAEQRLGPVRIKEAYAYKQLLETNDWMPLGTDFPVEDISPFKTFYAAVVRQDAKDFPQGGFQMENALSRQQALKGMTIWAAKAAFEEKEKGSLVAGKWADLIMLDQDIMKCKAENILKTNVLRTFINGEQVYAK